MYINRVLFKYTINQDPLDYCVKRKHVIFNVEYFHVVSLGNLHLSLSPCPCPFEALWSLV